MEDTDVRLVIRKLLDKWYWFALSLFITLGFAVVYLKVTDKYYFVEASIQLKDQSLGDKGTAQGKFISGFELLETDSELEDEIGVLTSYSVIRQSLEYGGFEVQYFQYPGHLGAAGKFLAQELYPGPFQISFDTAGWQLLYTPIYLTFINDKQYRLQIATEDPLEEGPLSLYNFASHRIIPRKTGVKVDTVLHTDQSFQSPYLRFKLEKLDAEALEKGASFYFTIHSLDDITDSYRGKLNTAPIAEESNIVNLSLTTTVPQKDIAFLDALSKVYIQNELLKKNKLGEKTIGFIDVQLQEVAGELNKAETKLESFRAKSNIIDVEVTSQNLNEQLFALEEKQAQLKVQNKFYSDMAGYLKRNKDVGNIVAPSSVGIQDASLNNLLIQLSTLNERKIAIDFNSSKNNPVLQVVEQKIQSTKKALLENINNLVVSNTIALQENSRRVNEIKQTIKRLPENERNLVNINRGFNFNDNIYNYLLQKRAEVGIALASNLPDKTVVDAPRQIGKGPVGPNKMLIFLIAFLAGFITPAALIFLRDFFQTKLENEEQLKYLTDIPVLERIAQIREKGKGNLYIDQSYLANTFRYIRRHINILQLSREVKAVGITSATSGEGKTFCALYLAQSFARAGHKTLLVDADLHQPDLDRHFKVVTQPGLSDYLKAGEEDIIQDTDFDNLDMVASGSPSTNPSDLLNKRNLDSLLSKWRRKYDIVIFDTPPVGLITDYFAFSDHIDYTLVVVRHEFTDIEHLKRLNKIIKENFLQTGIIYNGAKKLNYVKGYFQNYKKINEPKV
jgi:capsular exopolysaccharide synthesis family protein